MRVRLAELIASETHGVSYKTLKYGLDASDSPNSYEVSAVWEKSAESSHKPKYIDLQPLRKNLALSSEQIFTFFLDGSRKVFKVDEIAYGLSGGRRAVYPIIAGQIITGICRRENRKMIPETHKYEIVLSLPETADYDNNAKRGFWQGLAQKLSGCLRDSGLEISDVLSYKTGRDSRNTSFVDRATATIQTRMLETEKHLTEYLTRKKLLNHRHYLIKDGSLEYRQKSGIPFQNYRWVIGLSKSFNPEACMNIHGKADPGYIADLPVNHRTQAACFSYPEFLGEAHFAVWYIRLHDRKNTRSAFDGIVKAEKLLVTHDETASQSVNSDEIDTLSAYILNERYPVCYGSDSRWASHIYPVYLTEQYIKSKYISAESFMHLF